LKITYLGLGSNLGDRRRNLEDAIERLESPDLRVLRASSIYETAPRDVADQPWFLNQVHARAKKIERELGRKPSFPNGPRLIDIDILLLGGAIVSTPELEIPHPRMAERRFVLEPLAELIPEMKHPLTRRSVREMLAQVRDQAIRQFHPD
jgi:2-amino-4-hydroxy-6-hydroxymethyldihydropteridine diphosphokinase